jgi:hypothetical protein
MLYEGWNQRIEHGFIQRKRNLACGIPSNYVGTYMLR